MSQTVSTSNVSLKSEHCRPYMTGWLFVELVTKYGYFHRHDEVLTGFRGCQPVLVFVIDRARSLLLGIAV